MGINKNVPPIDSIKEEKRRKTLHCGATLFSRRKRKEEDRKMKGTGRYCM
jgi:hypothetical protein